MKWICKYCKAINAELATECHNCESCGCVSDCEGLLSLSKEKVAIKAAMEDKLCQLKDQ